jgi:photosystem II stability/assembly factor-like uncharacterized protein
VKLASVGVLALVLTMGGAAQARTSRQVVPVSIAFWDATHGVTAAAVYGPTSFGGQLSVTRDGGRTWEIVWRGRQVGYVATVPRTTEAWAQVYSSSRCPECRSLLLHTRDAGRTWQRAGSAPSSFFRPSFPTSRVGFVMGSRQANAGPLLKTTDHGNTWRRIGNPCRHGWGGYAWAASVSFASVKHGWLVCTGQPGAGNQSKAVYETVDGGKRWRRIVNVYFEPRGVRDGGLARYGYLHGIGFDRSGRGLLWQDRTASYLTSDGGRSWRPISATRAERIGMSGWFVSKRVAFLLVQAEERYELLKTGDGGRTWRLVRVWSRR